MAVWRDACSLHCAVEGLDGEAGDLPLRLRSWRPAPWWTCGAQPSGFGAGLNSKIRAVEHSRPIQRHVSGRINAVTTRPKPPRKHDQRVGLHINARGLACHATAFSTICLWPDIAICLWPDIWRRKQAGCCGPLRIGHLQPHVDVGVAADWHAEGALRGGTGVGNRSPTA